MTGIRLNVGFDEVRADPTCGTALFSMWPGNADRPVWSYWFPLMCSLSRGAMRPVPVEDPAAARERYAYPVELRFEADEWCEEAPAGDLIAVFPPAVEKAIAAGQVLVVVSVAHEGRPLDGDMSGQPGVLDRVAALGRWYGLSPRELWFVTGNLDAAADAEAWRVRRGLAGLPFTLRACEPFSAFTGGCARESLSCGRAPRAEVSLSPRGVHAIGWRSTRVSWVAKPFPGLADGRAAGPARFRYACLNRMFRRHRWQVLTRLDEENLLDEGLVSFPRPSEDDLRAEDTDAGTDAGRRLMKRLPLSIDRTARFDDGAFFEDNSAFVWLHPAAVLRECALEIVTETRQSGCRFVSEKAFKSLLGRGPAAVVGTRGTLAYLHSLGAQSWPGYLDESYDEISDDDQRLTAAMDSAVEFAGRPGWSATDAGQTRAANLRWLTQASMPWDRLIRDLADELAGW